MAPDLERLIVDAIHEIDLAKDEAWVLLDGHDASGHLERLRENLTHLRGNPSAPRRGLTRSVSDWIPDLEHPLVRLLSRIEHLDSPA